MQHMVNKRIFLGGKTCLTRGWYLRSSGIQIPLTKADQFRINEGIEIGKIARSLYPQGTLVSECTNILNYEKTKELIGNNHIQVIFEAAFIHNDNIARADILERKNGEWHLIEVKSSVVADKIKDELIDDLTYTTVILKLCGIEPTKMSLLLVSKNYRLGMDNRDFFVEIDCTTKVNERKGDFLAKVDEIATATGLPKKPEPKFIYECKDCDYYKDYCLGKNIDDSIFDLPRLGEKKFKLYTESNISLISQITNNDDLSATQRMVWDAVINKKSFLDKVQLKSLLDKIKFPTYYLDFESVSTALPLYENIGPYEEIVTQYSIHKFEMLNSNEEHFEFLADYTKDDRKFLSEKLLKDIGTEGSVIVFHAAAEKRFINNLIKALPEYSNELSAIINRIIDLEDIIKASYYDPNFHGSYSIKVVLPTLVPDMSYEHLAIGDGQSATVAFAELARGKYTSQEACNIRNQLLAYCKQDTFAMVKIYNKLLSLCN